jgi:alanine racemase
MSRAGVDAARAERVLKTIHQFDQERSSAQKALRTHYQKLEELLSQNSTDENAYAAALKGLRDGRTQLQAIQNRQIDAVAKILKPSEQARLVREGVGMFGPGGRQGKRGGMWQGGAGCPADAPCGPGMGRGRGPRGGF